MSNSNIAIYNSSEIQKKIYNIRGEQVMLDSDLANFYDVETRRLNEQVKRTKERFPIDFMFQLTREEYDNLMSQFAISSNSSLRSQNAILKKEDDTENTFLLLSLSKV